MRARYVLPNLEALQISIQAIQKHSSSDRKDLIAFLVKIFESKSNTVIVGAAIFLIELIALKARNSRLSTELNNTVLNINKNNALSDEDRLLYLNHFYNYVKTNKIFIPSVEATVETENKQNAVEKLAAIDKAIKPVVDAIETRISNIIHAAVYNRPTVSKLLLSIGTLRQEYKAIVEQRKGQNSIFKKIPGLATTLSYFGYYFDTHPDHLKFLAFFNLLDDMIKKSLAEKDKTPPFKIYAVAYGWLLYVMKKIEQEYGKSYRSPEKSDFYKKCREALNLTHSQDLADLQKMFYLKDLEEYIAELVGNEKETHAKLTELGIDNAGDFLEQILQDINSQLTSKTFMQNCMLYLIQYGEMYAKGLIATELAKICYDTLGIGKGLGGIAGRYIGGFSGGALGGYLGERIGSQAEPELMRNTHFTAFNFAYAYLKDFFSSRSMTAVIKAKKVFHDGIETDIVADLYPTTLSPEQFALLENHNAWLNTVLELPSSKVSDQDKQRIRLSIPAPVPTVGAVEKLNAIPVKAESPKSKEPVEEFKPLVRKAM